MSAMISFPNARLIAGGIWQVSLPQGVAFVPELSSPARQVHVFLLNHRPEFDPDRQVLQIEAAAVRCICLCPDLAQQAVVIIDGVDAPSRAEGHDHSDDGAAAPLQAGDDEAPHRPRPAPSAAPHISPRDADARRVETCAPAGSSKGLYRDGDLRFVNSLPPSLQPLGRQLLQAIRAQYLGELKYYPSSNIFVETPDNFWAVKPQPRDLSIVLYVRGLPENFNEPWRYTLKRYRNSYSQWKLTAVSQIEDVLRLLPLVPRKRL